MASGPVDLNTKWDEIKAKFICGLTGCRWVCDDDGSNGVAGAHKCSRCGDKSPAIQWPKS